MRKLVLFIIVLGSVIIYGCTGKNIIDDVNSQNDDLQSRIEYQVGYKINQNFVGN